MISKNLIKIPARNLIILYWFFISLIIRHINIVIFDIIWLTFCRFFLAFFFVTLFLHPNSKTKIMSFVMKDVHIGQLIQEEMNLQGRNVTWLAKGIFCEKSNVYKMFKRKSIDLAQLMKVSEVLNHNFLKDCYEES